jgi:HK97 family phage major capsid protein
VDEKYFEGFWKSLRSANQAQLFQIQNASLGEGGSPSGDGSYLVPVSTAAEILPLAAYECAARQVFKVVSTDKNIYLPVQSARSTAAIKPESNNSGQNSFTTTVPQFSNVLLSAFVLGNSVTVSTELFDDVPTLADFVSSEMQRAIQAQEEVYFTSGSGDGQPQGILDNVTTASGASITDGGAALSINAVLDTMGSLPKAYINRAVWLTNRIEAVRLLKAQLAADQYQQFISFDGPNGGMKLLGFDMFFSYEIPTYIASPSTSGEWIFGDLRSAATIGDRNGSAIKVRVLDQVGALQGQVTIVGQRRTDMRVTISEAAVQFSATS